jgi:hypothetical protein
MPHGIKVQATSDCDEQEKEKANSQQHIFDSLSHRVPPEDSFSDPSRFAESR